ncbi:MAG TPA: short-chain dehydrogenase [Gammaproteobacteria bacterium]|jgi:short-subunit dehydrogenase|uniref:SDR family NAD(P)-dependent oxidoreductase n=1 Tax=unclassified Ketobacter TaxID=2639109 RepID=UPI000E806517|nr:MULTISPECIES: SDR family NAD(P)-dependent oxidoreductase [unclassified Ketobacter]RLT90312.1 MAG: SDR family NAD(P)-dependent oxidoreductase [Ketobacter sp. GenoA1]RLT95713.1 MAG: SDR family NAD(P)-dependent oxidoreductase [Ketobacter sp.]HAG92603.1 short-chain dehydrogenase [Gammaproteobacteria bacterium]HBO91786.1 short-chain dehydrogenase [Gammaproteobacteria bacterium]|tara:strand:- start:130 stop:957 length:828 start_codon:yes stop_codon:yes gene_type:complete
MTKQPLPPSRNAAAVVTGAGSGIGRSFAYELARRGGVVICSDINEARAEQVAASIQALGSKAIPHRCDVGDAEEMAALSDEAEKLLGRPVTLVINNAGVGLGGPIGEVSLEDWHWCMNVNLWGVIHGCHFFAPKLRDLGYGGIINVASAAAFGAAPEMSTYNVTKAGVLALSETLAAELAGTGVNVTALCPTVVPTNIVNDGKLPEKRREFARAAMTRFALITADKVARQTLDTLDRGELYMLPQIDGRMAWRFKRLMPRLYTRIVGETYHLLAD